jgi:hypothetical protein
MITCLTFIMKIKNYCFSPLKRLPAFLFLLLRILFVFGILFTQTNSAATWVHASIADLVNVPSNPDPADQAKGIGLNPTLGWSLANPDGNSVTYEIYLDADINPPVTQVSNGQTEASFTPGALEPGVAYYWEVAAVTVNNVRTDGPVWQFRTNTPPNVPSNPSPTDGATDVDGHCPTLSWTGGDPDGDNVTYDVYLDGSIVSSANPNTDFIPFCGPWGNFGITFSWSIVATDSNGSTSVGPDWVFTTYNPVSPPDLNPTPPDGATDVSINPTLSWTSVGEYFQVYLDTTNPPGGLFGEANTTSYVPNTLKRGTTYYWQIFIYVSHYDPPIPGPVWSFTTSYASTVFLPRIIQN